MEIRARSLTRSFPARGRFGLLSRRRPAARGITLAVADGEVVALAGENGSGKTTTLRLLAGLLAPDSGEALLGGLPAAAARARRRLGYAGEQDRFPPGLRVGAVLRYAAVLAGFGGREARREAGRAAGTVGLDDLDAPAARCSRGIRRRLSLAVALVGRPRALILDEPLTGLDPVARARSLAAIREAAGSGAAVLVSLHEAAAVEALADRLVLLADGAVAGEGTPSGFRRASAEPGGPGGPGDWLAAALAGPRPHRR